MTESALSSLANLHRTSLWDPRPEIRCIHPLFGVAIHQDTKSQPGILARELVLKTEGIVLEIDPLVRIGAMIAMTMARLSLAPMDHRTTGLKEDRRSVIGMKVEASVTRMILTPTIQ